jgi:hypothetical protein
VVGKLPHHRIRLVVNTVLRSHRVFVERGREFLGAPTAERAALPLPGSSRPCATRRNRMARAPCSCLRPARACRVAVGGRVVLFNMVPPWVEFRQPAGAGFHMPPVGGETFSFEPFEGFEAFSGTTGVYDARAA